MDYKSEDQFMQRYSEFMASDCNAQLPVFSPCGRGLRGDSFRIDEGIEDNGVVLTGISTDYSEGEEHEAWKVVLSDAFPQLYYRLYEGVREIDGQYWNGWYLTLMCKVNMAAFPIWSFDTPFTPTSKWTGSGAVPADVIISSNF